MPWKGWRNRTALSRLSVFPGLARFYSVLHLFSVCECVRPYAFRPPTKSKSIGEGLVVIWALEASSDRNAHRYICRRVWPVSGSDRYLHPRLHKSLEQQQGGTLGCCFPVSLTPDRWTGLLCSPALDRTSNYASTPHQNSHPHALLSAWCGSETVRGNKAKLLLVICLWIELGSRPLCPVIVPVSIVGLGRGRLDLLRAWKGGRDTLPAARLPVEPRSPGVVLIKARHGSHYSALALSSLSFFVSHPSSLSVRIQHATQMWRGPQGSLVLDEKVSVSGLCAVASSICNRRICSESWVIAKLD